MLEPKIKDRIAKEADAVFPENKDKNISDPFNGDQRLKQYGYIAGAEKEAEMAAGLVEQMGYAIKRIDEYHSHTGETGVGSEVRSILNHALTKYNTSK